MKPFETQMIHTVIRDSANMFGVLLIVVREQVLKIFTWFEVIANLMVQSPLSTTLVK